MTNLTRRAALLGGIVSSAALAAPIGHALAAKDASAAPPAPATIPDHAAAIAELLKASGDDCSITITADWVVTYLHPEAPSSRVVRLGRELSEALAQYSDGQFRAIVNPGEHDVWLQATYMPVPARKRGGCHA